MIKMQKWISFVHLGAVQQAVNITDTFDNFEMWG